MLNELKKWAKDYMDQDRFQHPDCPTAAKLLAYKLSLITPHSQDEIEPLAIKLINVLKLGYSPRMLMAALEIATCTIPKSKDDD